MSENSTNITSKSPDVQKNVLIMAAIFYLFAIVNEFLAINNPFISAVASVMAIFMALNIAAWNHKSPLYRLLPALALVPFMRLLSLVLPLTTSISQIWYLLVALPVLVSVAMILRNLRISPREIGLCRSPWMIQLQIALIGLPLGFIGYLILRPQPLFSSTGLLMWVVNLLVILFFISFTEEVLFRGILFRVLSEINGQFASLSLAILYACLHFGSKSPIYAIYMGLVGWLFNRFVRQTGSIWGVVIANFLIFAGMGLFWPMLP